jgi:Asp-tRNA(Asn)/Glu-tRNA(Gln) amidotransferase A subunit family amidase
VSYDPKIITAPRLAGAGLRAFARLVEQPVSGRVVRDQLLRQIGLDTLRLADVTGFGTQPGPLPSDPRAWPTDPAADPVEQALRAGTDPPQGFAPPSIARTHRALRDGRTDPVALAEAFLAAVAASEIDEPPLRAFIHQDPDDLLQQARESSTRWRAGHPRGPLDGIPVPVKDELHQVPYPTTAGTRLDVPPATRDATAVARLRQAGALLVGKTNMHELGSGLTGMNPHWGTPRNPFDPARICGGSSSGSAAAVSSGLAPVSLACDGGGSIRMPAAFTGVVGLKPTLGRISHAGAFDLVWTTSHAGPIGMTVSDVALAYLAMAGPDPADPRTLSQPPPHVDGLLQDDLRGVTLGVYRDWFEDADEAIVTACREQLARYRDAGAEVRELILPDLELVSLAHLVLIGVEMAETQLEAYDGDRRRFSHETRVSMALSRGLKATDYVRALRLRSRLRRQWLDATAGLDALITPATGMTAPLLQSDAEQHGESDLAQASQIMRFMPAGNLLGFPAITFPVGYDAAGMPIAMQAMGRPWLEARLLRLARVAERQLDRRRPVRWYGA